MKKYKYQMHAHTFPASDCGVMLPKELVYGLRLGGYSGCVLTNHFMGGNTGVDRNLPWEDFVNQFTLDYLIAAKEAEKYDIDIIFGLEEGVGNGLEILCYGVTPEILNSHPELKGGSCEDWYRAMHENGALCIQAHPFRTRGYIPEPSALPLEFIDGIEVYNASNSDEDNRKAAEFAAVHPELICVSGADAHDASYACISGIETDCRIANGSDLIRVLKAGEYRLLK